MNIEAFDFCHAEAAHQLEKECFSEPWSQSSFKSLLKSGIGGGVAAMDDRVGLLGYVAAYFVADECQITNVAVKEAFRRQGIARAMLQHLLVLCEEKRIVKVTLEVRCGNANAIALYESLGFLRDGIRKNFYAHPKEDALLMSKALSVFEE